MLQEINDQTHRDPKEAIPKLEEWVYKLSLEPHMEKDDRPVFRASQRAMISIPGHAEYYRNKIRADLKMLHGSSEEALGIAGSFEDRQIQFFQMLALLPSPETVAVLGEFLNEEDEDSILKNIGGSVASNYDPVFVPTPNSHRAVQALWKLIDNPLAPYRGVLNPKIDIPEWILWYNQVKAGTLTIRFKGDPQEYSLTGPVRGAKNPDISSDTIRPQVRDESLPESGKSSSSIPTSWIAGGIAALLAIVGWFFVRRNTAR